MDGPTIVFVNHVVFGLNWVALGILALYNISRHDRRPSILILQKVPAEISVLQLVRSNFIVIPVETYLVCKPNRRVQVVVVENIGVRCTARQQTNSTRCIDNTMVRSIDNGTAAIHQMLVLPVHERAAHISRATNSDTILLPAGREALEIKVATCAMAEPEIVIAVAITHPRPFLGPSLSVVWNEAQLHGVWLARCLDRE